MTASGFIGPNDAGRRQPLSGHRKIGKVFIPPALQMKQKLTEVNYLRDLLPEIVWIALLQESMGWKDGTAASLSIARATQEANSGVSIRNYALLGEFMDLSEEVKGRVVSALKRSPGLSRVRVGLEPLTALYEGFPLAFLGLPAQHASRGALLARLKRVVAGLFDKGSQSALMAQATVVYVRTALGLLVFPKDLDLPNLDAIVDDPESEEAKRAGGFVRATVIMELTPHGGRACGDWVRSFWVQGLLVDECRLGENDD